jgi:hypothetical protein
MVNLLITLQKTAKKRLKNYMSDKGRHRHHVVRVLVMSKSTKPFEKRAFHLKKLHVSQLGSTASRGPSVESSINGYR